VVHAAEAQRKLPRSLAPARAAALSAAQQQREAMKQQLKPMMAEATHIADDLRNLAPPPEDAVSSHLPAPPPPLSDRVQCVFDPAAFVYRSDSDEEGVDSHPPAPPPLSIVVSTRPSSSPALSKKDKNVDDLVRTASAQSHNQHLMLSPVPLPAPKATASPEISEISKVTQEILSGSVLPIPLPPPCLGRTMCETECQSQPPLPPNPPPTDPRFGTANRDAMVMFVAAGLATAPPPRAPPPGGRSEALAAANRLRDEMRKLATSKQPPIVSAVVSDPSEEALSKPIPIYGVFDIESASPPPPLGYARGGIVEWVRRRRDDLSL